MPQQAFEVDRDGMTLRGMTYRPSKAAAAGRYPTVLLLHGFTGQRIESGFMFVHLARALCDRGIAAVTFDFMHSGESDGSFDQMLVTGELADALRMTQWTLSQPFVDRSRLGLLGFSLGGLLAACVMGRSDAYKALALLAPTTVDNLCRHARNHLDAEDAGQLEAADARCPTPTGPVIRGPHVLHRDFFADIVTLDPLADITKRPCPTLLVQGTGDKAVPPDVSQAFADAATGAGAPLTHRLIQDADHVFNHPDHRANLLPTTADWLANHL